MARRHPRPPRPPAANPIQEAVSKWISTISPPDEADTDAAARWQQELREDAPKRFTVYEPMALLPAGSFSSAAWTAELARHSTAAVDSLWTLLLQEISKNGRSSRPLTHLAANEGIPLQDGGATDTACDNVMRRPSGLRMLHGDFGPAEAASPPSEDDLARAFWVSTRQNGILQTWAPRWTMFSRGNVKEKARLLGFPPSDGDAPLWAVDLYAGIGYFAFCYAKLGMRVLCWELNPWSVEALRRGAERNRWTVDVFRDPAARGLPSADVAASTARIVVMAEDNAGARPRAADLMIRHGWLRDLAHVNCGLLPSSRPTWDCALSLASSAPAARRPVWLHLHENVGEPDIERRGGEIEALLREELLLLPVETGLSKRNIRLDRVEKVKTYAPGVWHCVFDLVVAEPPTATTDTPCG